MKDSLIEERWKTILNVNKDLKASHHRGLSISTEHIYISFKFCHVSILQMFGRLVRCVFRKTFTTLAEGEVELGRGRV